MYLLFPNIVAINVIFYVLLSWFQRWGFIWDELAGQFAEGITLTRLRDSIKYSTIGHGIPDEYIIKILVQADKNMDGYLERKEFMSIVSILSFILSVLLSSKDCIIDICGILWVFRLLIM